MSRIISSYDPPHIKDYPFAMARIALIVKILMHGADEGGCTAMAGTARLTLGGSAWAMINDDRGLLLCCTVVSIEATGTSLNMLVKIASTAALSLAQVMATMVDGFVIWGRNSWSLPSRLFNYWWMARRFHVYLLTNKIDLISIATVQSFYNFLHSTSINPKIHKLYYT